MGGVLILGGARLSTLLWARLGQSLCLDHPAASPSPSALIGFADDYAKVSARRQGGVGPDAPGHRLRHRRGGGAAAIHPDELPASWRCPVFKDVLINLGFLFIPFAMIVIVGAANAVNLTDGLDGLAIMPVMIAAGTLGVIAYAVGRVDFTEYLDVHYVPGTGELLVFTAG
jgi:phospho-N-acetylmuramoyl-pentapeptide-transferase